MASDTVQADKLEQQKATTGAAIKEDFESLQLAREAVEKALGKYGSGKAIYYNKLEEAKAMLVAIEKFESNDKQALLQEQEDFGEKHGTTAEVVRNREPNTWNSIRLAIIRPSGFQVL